MADADPQGINPTAPPPATDTGTSAAPSPAPPSNPAVTASPGRTAPATTPAAPEHAALLGKYASLGEDHPTVIQLREALARNQTQEIQQLTGKLDALLTPKVNPTPAPQAPRPNWLWSVMGAVILAFLFLGCCLCYLNAKAQAIIARNPIIQRTGRLEISKKFGGPTADQLVEWVQQEIEGVRPDRILFIGNTLYKAELVRYLSDKAVNGTTVTLVFGRGSPLLGKDAVSLAGYHFSNILAAPWPFNTQMLIALNEKENKAAAFLGTFPFDRNQAEATENVLVEITDPDQCSKLITAYNDHILDPSVIVYQQKK